VGLGEEVLERAGTPVVPERRDRHHDAGLVTPPRIRLWRVGLGLPGCWRFVIVVPLAIIPDLQTGGGHRYVSPKHRSSRYCTMFKSAQALHRLPEGCSCPRRQVPRGTEHPAECRRETRTCWDEGTYTPVSLPSRGFPGTTSLCSHLGVCMSVCRHRGPSHRHSEIANDALHLVEFVDKQG
jgi:hypothetical protein